MITFDTTQLKSRRTVKIDGHTYVVRRMGNIENLEYNRAIRKLQALVETESKRKLTKPESEQVDSISEQLGDMTVALFDDGGDQSKSRTLVSSLNENEINELMTQIFSEKQDDKETELPTANA